GMRDRLKSFGCVMGALHRLIAAPTGSARRRHSIFGGEVGGFEHPTIRRLTPSCRHQLSPIAPPAPRPICSYAVFRVQAEAAIASVSLRPRRCWPSMADAGTFAVPAPFLMTEGSCASARHSAP